MNQFSFLVKAVVILALAAGCLYFSLIFMPWAEMNFTGDFPPWCAWALTPLHVSAYLDSFTKFGLHLQNTLKSNGAANNFGDYAYVLMMSVAMVLAAVAIIVIGRDDAEEKTLLPTKK